MTEIRLLGVVQNPANGFPARPLGDKGYDSLENIKHLVSLGLIPVVAVRLPEKDEETGKRLYDGIYDKRWPADLHRRQVHGVRRNRPRGGPPVPLPC